MLSRQVEIRVLALLLTVLPARFASAVVVGGGGAKATDCIAVFDATGPNTPAPPRAPRHIDCVDGDTDCDTDGLRNGACLFDLRVCVNSTAIAACTPLRASEVTVAHAIDVADPRFDVDFQALQQRIDLLDFSSPGDETLDDCSLGTTITVALKPVGTGGLRRTAKKRLHLTSEGVASGRHVIDGDTMRLTCRPEGNAMYTPRDLYSGTFDRIAQEVFAPSCAVAGCHDSEAHQANLILLPNAAYSTLVNVTPTTPPAAIDGLKRIMPGDPTNSFLYRKITADLLPGYGQPMPLLGPSVSPALIEIIRLWIIGDSTLGPAPEDDWVEGTDG